MINTRFKADNKDKQQLRISRTFVVIIGKIAMIFTAITILIGLFQLEQFS